MRLFRNVTMKGHFKSKAVLFFFFFNTLLNLYADLLIFLTNEETELLSPHCFVVDKKYFVRLVI